MRPRHFAAAFAAVGAMAGAATSPVTPYAIVKTVPLGAPDRWDYVVFDAATKRVYIAHGDRLTVLDARSAEIVGEVQGIAGGTHGTAISVATGEGFTDDGGKGEAVAFDLKTLAVTHRIAAAADADAIARDAATGHIFIVEGDPGTITVIDPTTDTSVATIVAGEKLEYAAGDGRGTVYVAGEEKSDLLKIDARSNAVVARWPTPNCTNPHGLAVDTVGERVFMSCTNGVMMVVDTLSGRIVAELPIGKGSDAVAFDAKRRRVFSSNGRDGTITVYQQTSPNAYQPLPAIATAASGRTMTVDSETGRLFVVAADTDPSPTPTGRPKVRPGSAKVLVLDPIE